MVGHKVRKKAAVDSGNNSAPIAARATEGRHLAAREAHPLSPGYGEREERGTKKIPEDGRGGSDVSTRCVGDIKETLRLAIDKIDLASLDINGLTARKALTGAQLFEVGGPNNKEKADVLASRMRDVLADKEGWFTAPVPPRRSK